MTEYMEPPYSIPGVVHPKQVLSPGSFRQSSNFVKGSAGWKLDGDGSVDIFGLEASLLIADTSDTSCFVALFEAATGNLVPKTDAGLTYNAGTAALTATTFVGALTGNASGSSGSCTGNAATATALETARTIGGVSFNGTGNINLPGVNTAGNQDTSGTAADATVLETARTINGVSFNGSANITVTAAAGTLSGSTLASGVTASSLTSVGTLASLAISSGTNISPDSAGAGQFKVTGTDYTGFIANDGTAMHVGHNSSSRGLYFMTDETTRLAITGAGLVGIGTTSPSEQLHVYEAGTGNDWRGRAVFGGQDQVVVAGSYAGKAVVGAHNTALNAWGDLILNYAGGGGGKVGIGTTSPDRLLTTSGAGTVLHHIHATDSNQSYTQYTNSTTGTTLYTDGLLVGVDTNETAVVWNSEGTSLRFGTSAIERMTILHDGKVGIGTTAPGSLFHVEGAGGAFAFAQFHSTNSDRAYLNITNSTTGSGYDNGLLLGVASTEEVLIWNRENTHITFAVNNAEKMRLAADGSLGIGTTAPNGKLEIIGTAYHETLRIKSNDGNGRGITFYNSSNTSLGMVGFPNNDDMHLWGIGSSMYFYVNGNYRFYSSGGGWYPYVTDTYDLGFTSKKWDDVYATNGTIITSDISAKSDVIDTPLGLDFVKALRPIQYRWNEGTRNHQGFIAQDVEQALDDSDGVTAAGTAMWMHAPHNNATEMVPVENEDGIPEMVEEAVPDVQMLRYTEFIAPLVKAVQELAARVEALEDA